jgi:hypothetical protein
MTYHLENIERQEALDIDATVTNVLPLGGFFKGDPIKKTTDYKTARECTVNTDAIHGICVADKIFPYTNKVLEVATEGEVEVTASAAVALNSVVGLDLANPRRFAPLVLNAAGATYRQGYRAKSIALANGDKFIIDLEPLMVTV